MALPDDIEGVLKSRDVEPALEVKHECNVVKGVAWIQLIEEPKALLGRRENRCGRSGRQVSDFCLKK